jgi:GNAT superfamily N-acetyltransferase
MNITQLSAFDDRSLDLVRLIDRGEHQLEVQGSAFPGFGEFIARCVIQDERNYGVFAAFFFNGALRIHLVFEDDIRGAAPQPVIQCLLATIGEVPSRRAHLWCSGHNPRLVSYLKRELPTEENVYSADELVYTRERIMQDQVEDEMDTSPLVPVPYSDDLLDSALELLEDSFAAISTPGSFTSSRDSYKEKLSSTAKSRFEGFRLGDELVGLYYHNDAEIEYIAVSRSQQRRGFGALILKRALLAAFRDSDRDPHLYCVSDNTDALRFYLREGWSIAGKPVRLTVDLSREA